MYLLYVDESGKPFGSGDKHFVVAGLALHEHDCYPFAQSVQATQKKLAGNANAQRELHATDIWSARNDWVGVDKPTRIKLLNGIFDHISKWTSPAKRRIRLFAAVVHKSSVSKNPDRIMERGHEELLSHFDEYLTRLHHKKDSHRSLVIADNSSYEFLVQTLAGKWKATGTTTKAGRIHSLAEVPLYVDSRASKIVQAADFVAWGLWNYYENGHPEYLSKINRRFDSLDGVQHGVTHLNRKHESCVCIPCASRRSKTIPSAIPVL